MAASKTAKPKPQKPKVQTGSYHHGDLRQALLDAARTVLETASPEAVTLKSLAQMLGVSQSAPYRHFETRDAVLAAVAADGFVRFREALSAARGEAPTDPFEQACLAYVAFGRANRGVYKLMFASPIVTASQDGALGGAADAAFQFLIQGVETHASAGQALTVATWVWSTLHGLVMLEADGFLKRGDDSAATIAAVVHRLSRAIRS